MSEQTREQRRIEKLRPHPGEGHPRRPLKSLPFRERTYWRLFRLARRVRGKIR